jgi:hypothetical protein
MRRFSPVAIVLSDTERAALAAIVRRHQSPQPLAQWARILIQAAVGVSNPGIALGYGPRSGAAMATTLAGHWRL